MIIRSMVLLALTLGGLTAAVPGHAGAHEASTAPRFDEQVLYQAGTSGYSCFRIPAVVRTTEGTLLAFAEGRVNNCSDTGDIDLVLRRSTDAGRTWGPLQVVIEGNGDTRGNPVPLVDQRSGRISLLSTRNPGDNQHVRHPYLQHSLDDGLTWTEPVDITEQVSKPEWEWWYGTGPVHGIQLTRGEHAGRLVVPSYFGEGTDKPGGVVLVYSDDGGLSWQRGAIDRREGTTLVPGENSVVELVDGRLYISARESGSTPEPGHRAYAVSSDAGESFEAPFVTEPALQMPMVQGATLRSRAVDEGDRHNRILFSAPAHPAARDVMSIRSSYDEGRTWETWQEGKVIWWGPAAYSDLVEIDRELTGLLYEAGGFSPYESLRWARFDEAYLATPNGTPPGIPGPPTPGPRTPDWSDAHNPAYVRGGAVLGEGRFDQALVLDGTDDRVEVPYDGSIDLGDGDFTWSAWFKYSATTGSHALLWSYRVGSGTTPQIWLRAEPGNNRIAALMGTGYGQRTLYAPGAYNDGRWHHVALTRAQGGFALRIDGAEAAVAPAPIGSVTEGREFGVQGISVGQRVDGANRFRGSLDEVRVYRRALSPAELDQLARSNPAIRSGLALRLAFEQIR